MMNVIAHCPLYKLNKMNWFFFFSLQKSTQKFPSVDGLGFCRLMRAFPCHKSNHFTQDAFKRASSSCVYFTLIGKNKRRPERTVTKKKHVAKPSLNQSATFQKKRKRGWKNTGSRLQPDLIPPTPHTPLNPRFPILEILWMENVRLSKASWIQLVVLVSSSWCSSAKCQQTDGTSKCTLATWAPPPWHHECQKKKPPLIGVCGVNGVLIQYPNENMFYRRVLRVKCCLVSSACWASLPEIRYFREDNAAPLGVARLGDGWWRKTNVDRKRSSRWLWFAALPFTTNMCVRLHF